MITMISSDPLFLIELYYGCLTLSSNDDDDDDDDDDEKEKKQ